jgi:hypothetical protein
MRRYVQLGAFLALFLAAEAVAADTAAPVRAEIEALLSSLETSGCDFNRNGTWYSAADAKKHLLRKLAYIERGQDIGSTEQFIALAASKSSISGEPYQVRCAGGALVGSSEWLSRRLRQLRK